MSLFGFNKRTKHRNFDYIPRFYDPQKEELEERLKKYDDKDIDKTELAKNRIQAGLRAKYRVDETYKSQVKSKSNRTLLYIIIILTLLSIVIIRSSKFIEFLEGI